MMKLGDVMLKYKSNVVIFVVAGFAMLALFQNCTDNYKVGTEGSNNLLSQSIDLGCSFNGQTVPEGQSVVAFLDSTEGFGQQCISQNRVCQHDQLSGSYTFGSCSVAAPRACLFNGQTMTSGDQITAFVASTVPFGQNCVSQSRLCTDGSLSGSYTFAACAPEAPASCLFNGQTVTNGSSINGYLTSTVPFGQTCQSESRVCTNGNLSGSDTYGSCTPAAPASCLFNGQTIPSGGSVIGYQASTVPFGQTCQQESRVCTNGVLSGSASFGSCDVDIPASCIFNGQTISSGNTVTAYQNASVQAGSQCVSEVQTCTNGSLSGTFTNPSCTVAVCDPFTNPSATCTSSSPGLKGSLWYEPAATVAAQGGWTQLSTFFSQGTNANITLILSQLNIPTENFSAGFPIGNGQYLSDLSGNKLVEWFAIQVDGVLKLAPGDAPGDYEFATLSDDGSILYLRDTTSGQLVPRVLNDGAHSTRLACIDTAVTMDSTSQIPMRLQYFQGPRTEIALRMLYRPKSATPESLCGSSSGFFVSTGTGIPSYPEGASMTQLYGDGWKVLTANQFGSPQ
jgi:hypothetical protein